MSKLKKKDLIVLDVNYLPSEYKGEGGLDKFKGEHPNYEFLFVDFSKKNTQGNNTNNAVQIHRRK